MMKGLFSAALLLIALAAFATYVRPTYIGEITALRAEITDLDAALSAAAEYDTKEAELTRARNQLNEADLLRLATFLPDGVDNIQLILDLDALADRSEIQLSDFDIQGGEEENRQDASLASENGPVDSLDLTVSAVGTYEGFRTFLAGVEQSLRLIDVVSLSVTDSSTGVYTYTMTLRLYWLR